MNAHPDCYSSMFPDFTQFRFRQKLESHVFSALVTSSGIGPQGRTLEVKRDAWAKCVACADYRTCYDLSLAKLLTNDILINTMVANPWVGNGD